MTHNIGLGYTKREKSAQTNDTRKREHLKITNKKILCVSEIKNKCRIEREKCLILYLKDEG